VRNPVTRIDVRPDQDALEHIGGPPRVTTRDRRLKQLRFLIEDGSEREQSLNALKWVFQVSKRVHLVELTAKYTEEVEAKKAELIKGRRSSVKERFTDLLFSHMTNCKSKKGKQGS